MYDKLTYARVVGMGGDSTYNIYIYIYDHSFWLGGGMDGGMD